MIYNIKILKIIKNIFLLICVFTLSLTTLFSQINDTNDTNNTLQAPGTKRFLLRIIENQKSFFQDFHYDMDDFSPSFFRKFYSNEWRRLTSYQVYDNILMSNFYKKFQLSTNLLLNGFSILNYNIKIHLLSEAVFIPQITIGFSHFFYLPIYSFILPNIGIDSKKLQLQGYAPFLSFSKSLTSSLKFFTGYRYAIGQYHIKLIKDFQVKEENKEFFKTLQNKKDMKDQWKLHDFFFGVTYLPYFKNLESTFWINYNPFNKKIGLKFEKSFRYFSFGVGYYPQSIMKVRPFIKFSYIF